MRPSLSRFTTTSVVALIVVACGSTASQDPVTTPSSAPQGSPSATVMPLATPSASTASPSLPPASPSASLPVRRSAREIGLAVLMAPRPDGTLFVSIPRPGGSVLTLLDRRGAPLPGWPIVVRDATACGQLLPVENGSVRVVCTKENPDGNMYDPMGAFAFDGNGRALAGWPVDLLGARFSGRVIGEELTLFEDRPGSDVIEEGQPTYEGALVTIAADGSLTSGAGVPMGQTCCGDVWAVGPDGVAYGVVPATSDLSPQERPSEITALDLSGERAGWPISIDGSTSGPEFGPNGRIFLTVATPSRGTTRVLAIDSDGHGVTARSAELPIETGALWNGLDGTYECGVPVPKPPLVAQDGTVFVVSEIDTAIVALDSSLAVMGGWPYEPATPLVSRYAPAEGDLTCGSLAIPAVGTDNILYLPLQARTATTGGSLAAVGPDGRVRPGWPVELKRPGSEFWSVVVGSDGTAYALAIEPEANDTSSATILAIAPDSTVLWTTTILEP